MRKSLFTLAVFATVLAIGPVANAANIPYTTDGTWANPVPPGVTINNVTDPRTVRWGTPFQQPNQSGYDFSPISLPPAIAVTDGPAFPLGTFNHQNFPITGTLLQTVQLDFTINLDPLGGGAVPPTANATFQFQHEETPNQPPCAYGATNGPCNDRVLVSNLNLNQFFMFGGTRYFFNLVGFSTDGGTTISNTFITGESQQNPAVLYGRITERPIPEPTALLLLGAGLIGVATRLRRRD